MTRVLLLPSPLLPRLSHLRFLDALARCLRATEPGEGSVDVATFPRAPSDAQAVLAAFRESVTAGRPDIVLTHSNAGRYAALAAPGIHVVHVDAALPQQSGKATPMAPPAMLARLAEIAVDDVLPPWSRWWPEEDLARVLPDGAARAELHRGAPRLPMSYFRSELGAPPGWTEHPQAYLAFGDTYAEETALARRLGWPTTVLDGALHLHHLVDPDAVARAVLALAARLRDGSVRSAPGPQATTTG